MKGKSWKISVLIKMMVIFIAMILPIYILSIHIYQNGVRIIRQEISNTMSSQLSSYMTNLEDEIDRIMNLQLELLNDRDINRMATIPQSLSNIETVQSLLRIQQRLFVLLNSSQYIREVYVLIPAADRLISSSEINPHDPDFWESIDTFSWEAEGRIIYWEDRMSLNVAFPSRYYSAEKPLGIISVELSAQAFRDALASMIHSADEGIILHNRANERTFSISEDSSLSQELINLDESGLADTKVYEFEEQSYLVVKQPSVYLDSVLIKYVPEQSVFAPLASYQIWYGILIISVFVITLVYTINIYNFIHKPLHRLATAFQAVNQQNFKISIRHSYNDEFRSIYSHFNEMVSNLDHLIEQVYKQRVLVQKAEMKQLQSQINPHFLYNSFFILNMMSRTGDYENLEIFTGQLGRYFQFITRNAADEIKLVEEVDHARIYSEIQAMRYRGRIHVEFPRLPDVLADLPVPRLILQPIIENAFEHGLSNKSQDGYLAVSFELEDEAYRIIVENNGEDIDNDNLIRLQKQLSAQTNGAEVTALQNIHQRLQLKFGENSGLEIEKRDNGGLRVTIVITFTNEEEG